MEKGSSKITALIALLAVVIIGGGALLMMNNDSDDMTTNTTQSDQSAQNTQSQKQTEKKETAKTIVTLASETEPLSTLVAGVKAADLVDTLQGDGPFTVFAPTNDAFNALPDGTLETLLKPENKSQLASILTYHVVAGNVLSSDLSDGQMVTTVQGEKLTVKILNGKVYIVDAKGNEALVEQADVDASNGVVHIIDSVLLPS